MNLASKVVQMQHRKSRAWPCRATLTGAGRKGKCLGSILPGGTAFTALVIAIFIPFVLFASSILDDTCTKSSRERNVAVCGVNVLTTSKVVVLYITLYTVVLF